MSILPQSQRRFRLGLVALFALSSACSGKAAPATAEKPGPDVLRLANNIADGAHLADELGIFAKHNIRIEWTGKQAHGPAAIVSLVAGQNDAAGSISTAMIIARTHGAKLKIIASSTLSSREAPLFRYLVRDDSPMTGKPQDFIGKKVVAAPTTIVWYPLVVYMKRAGVDYRNTEFITLPSPLATEQALLQGDVAAIGSSEIAPPGSKLLAQGGVHFLPGISDYDILEIEQIGGWAMREDYIAQHPDVVRRFIASLAEAYQWGNANSEKAQEILNRRNDIPREYWKYQKTWRKVPQTARVDPESIRKWIAILEDFGQVEPGSIKPQDVFSNEYNPLADKS